MQLCARSSCCPAPRNPRSLDPVQAAIGNLGRLPAVVRTGLDPLRHDSSHHEAMTLTLALQLRRPREDRDRSARARARGRRRHDEPGGRDRDGAPRSHAEPGCRRDPTCSSGRGASAVSRTSSSTASLYAELHFADVLWPDFTVGPLARRSRELSSTANAVVWPRRQGRRADPCRQGRG